MPLGKDRPMPIDKNEIKQELAACLSREKEVRRVVVFGSFLTVPAPHDLDVAVFQDSDEDYLPLALRYRRATRSIARRIPLDIFPVRPSGASGPFLAEIARGEVIYER
jgi:predicted nucleotidyltransferase